MMRAVKHISLIKQILISLLVVIVAGILLYHNSDLKSIGYSVISKEHGADILYPEVLSEDSSVKNQYEKANRVIRENLSGPYSFLFEEDVDVSMDYEVMHKDRDILSICFKGTYIVDKNRVNQFSFGLNLNMKTQTLLTLADVIGDDGMAHIEKDMLKIDEELDGQKAFEDNNFYYYCLLNHKIQIILTGYPSLAGNYRNLAVDYNWQSGYHRD